MLIVWTTFFLWLITFSGNVVPALIGGGGVLGVIVCWGCLRRHGGKRVLRHISLLLLALSLALSSVRRRFHRYNALLTESGKGGYIGTGQIVENHGKGRYLFRDPSGREFLYYSEQVYPLGSELFTTASRDVPAALTGVFSLQPADISRLLTKVSVLQNADRERGFDKEKRLLMKGRAGSLYEKHALLLRSERNPQLVSLRQSLQGLITHAFSDQQTAGLTLGMLIGDRSLLTADAYSSFVESGLVHIIAVSGGNIVLIVSLLSAVLFFLPYYIRLACIASVVALYALICGFDSSVIRATCMALLSIAALFFGRNLSVWRSMGYTYLAMILRNPFFLLYDIGFIFSFSALAWLIYFADRRKMLTTKKVLYGSLIPTLTQLRWRLRNLSLLPSIAASIGIFPTLLFFTGRVNLLSILSNLLVVPLVPFVMIYGFCISFLYKYVSRCRLLLPQKRAVDWIYAVNERGVTHAVTINAQQWSSKIIIIVLTCIVLIALIVHHNNITDRKRMV